MMERVKPIVFGPLYSLNRIQTTHVMHTITIKKGNVEYSPIQHVSLNLAIVPCLLLFV